MKTILLLALAACAASAHPKDSDHVAVKWTVADATRCDGGECPGHRVDVTLVVTQGGAAKTFAVGQIGADADGDVEGVKNCRLKLESVSCSGTPQQEELSIAVDGAELVVTRREYVDDGGDLKEKGTSTVVQKIPLAGAGPFRLVAGP